MNNRITLVKWKNETRVGIIARSVFINILEFGL